ncbi:MAG TPA: AAA family ATPase [Polyangium sp.]|nr:AAA family ATPase [Polyangium sp.]
MWLELDLSGNGPTLQVLGRGCRGERPAAHVIAASPKLDLDDFSSRVSRAARASRPLDPNTIDQAQALYREILSGELHDVLLRLLEASKDQAPILVRLFLHDETLQAMPWEALCKPGTSEGFWGTDPRLVLARGVLSTEVWNPGTIEGAVRVLVIAPQESETTITTLRRVLPIESGEIEWLEPITGSNIDAERLYARLRNGPVPHIVHFIGHGSVDSTGKPMLRLGDDDDGDPIWISAESFARELSAHFASTLRLVILEACEGARPGVFGSAAECFAKAGASAVIAHLWPVRAAMARTCSSILYRSLIVEKQTRGDIGAAIAAMRRTLVATTAEAFSPILCLRGDNSVIFQFPDRKDPSEPHDDEFEPDAPDSVGPPCFGREKELARLRTLLDEAFAGKNSAALVIGEAGSGKSALVTAFCRQMANEQQPVVFVGARCLPRTGQEDPYAPIVEVLLHLVGAVRNAPMPTNRQALGNLQIAALQALTAIGADLIGPLLPQSVVLSRLTSLATHGHTWAAEAHAQLLKTNDSHRKLVTNVVYWQITEILTKVAAVHPLVLVFDDLQWLDDASGGLLLHLAGRFRAMKLMILGTCQSDVVAVETNPPHPMTLLLREITRIYGDVVLNLDALSAEDRKRCSDMLLDAEELPADADFRQSFFEHTGGHPLFALELLHAVRTRMQNSTTAQPTLTNSIPWGELPSRIEGVIGERLAGLETAEREMLGAASVEGSQFSVYMLSALRKEDERSLLRTISQGLEKKHRIVVSRGTQRIGPRRTFGYRFAQGLVQQYVYSGLSEGERMLLHGDIAECLEKTHEGQTESIAVVLAHHYTQAEDFDKAIGYLIQAGDRAIRLSAYREAIKHFERALELLKRIDSMDPTEKMRRELSIRLRLGGAYLVTVGGTKQQFDAFIAHTRELCLTLGDKLSLALVLVNMATVRFAEGDFSALDALATEVLEIGTALGAAHIQAHGHIGLMMASFWRSNIETTNHHIREVMRLCGSTDSELYENTGLHPLILAMTYSIWTTAMADELDKALEQGRLFVAMAEQLNNPVALIFALHAVATLGLFCEDRALCYENAHQASEIATKYELPFLLCGSQLLERYGTFAIESVAEYIAEIESLYRKFLEGGRDAVLYLSYRIVIRHAYHQSGQDERALAETEDALSFITKYGMYVVQSQWLYCKAESLLRLGRKNEAEQALREALANAQKMGVKFVERKILALLASIGGHIEN